MWIIKAIFTIIISFFQAIFNPKKLDKDTEDRMLKNIKEKGGRR